MLNFLKRTSGFSITIILSFTLIFVFFHSVFVEPNNNLFAPSGDGIKSTYCTLFHIEYDQEYWQTMAMNYPYGESVFFTENHTFPTNIIKFLKDIGLDASFYALGILNIWLLLSFVIGAGFLYLIFKKLKLPDWISILASLLIIFLSPQWERLGGHYNLAYAYVFPITIYLLMEFYSKPRYSLSIIISVFLFILSGKQLYFIVLTGILIVFIFIYIFFKEKERFGGRWKIVFHFFIQLLLPFLLFSLFTSFYDQNLDRTAYPWGFFQSTTRIESIFLPVMEPYGRFIHVSGGLRTVAYVGLIASLYFLYINIQIITKAVRRDYSNLFMVTDNNTLNLMYWASFVSFLISLGIPFTLGLQELLNYSRPLRQFRAIGRFIFPFYYLLNIVAIYLLAQQWKKSIHWWSRGLLVLALLFFTYDAGLNFHDNVNNHINKLDEFNDRSNVMESNRWVLNHDWNEYQALMPLPYFHIGSENYWLHGNSSNHASSFIASLKTGLPLNAVMLSRTSISESLKNIDLVMEPVSEFELLKDIPNNKPYLLMVYKKGSLNPNERRLVDHSIFLEENSDYSFYKLQLEDLNHLGKEYDAELKERALKLALSDSTPEPILFESFNDLADGEYINDIGETLYFC